MQFSLSVRLPLPAPNPWSSLISPLFSNVSIESKLIVLRFFHLDDIRAKHVTIDEVRNKCEAHDVLAKVEARKVYNKVQGLWQELSKEDCSPLLESLPKDGMSERVGRLLENNAPSDVSHCTTSKDWRRKFSDDELETMFAQCKGMLKEGSFTKNKITECMSKTDKGKAIHEKFDMELIWTRLKCEKLKKNSQSLSDCKATFIKRNEHQNLLEISQIFLGRNLPARCLSMQDWISV